MWGLYGLSGWGTLRLCLVRYILGFFIDSEMGLVWAQVSLMLFCLFFCFVFCCCVYWFDWFGVVFFCFCFLFVGCLVF